MRAQPKQLFKETKKVKRIVIPFRTLVKWLVRLRRSPRSIAGGFALGVFIAFTPTIGIQIVVVIFLSTLLNMNRPAAISTVWITNAATMAPIYTFNYWVGSLFWSGPKVSEVYKIFMDITVKLVKMDILAFKEQFSTILTLSSEIIIPLIIGSTIVGIVAAAFTYIFAISLIHFFLAKKKTRSTLTP